MPPTENSLREKIRIRPMVEGDQNFILHSWLTSFKENGPSVGRIINSEYFRIYEPILKSIIKRSEVYVACLREDEDVIIGYLAIERLQPFDVIHYCYVKEAWRSTPALKVGVASYLVEAANPCTKTYFTHWTKPIDFLISKMTYVYQPYLIMKQE